MAGVFPFRGLRYAFDGEALSRVLSPPYDVTTPQERETLYKADPHNIVRVDHVGSDVSDAAYQRAGAVLRSWCNAGVLIRDLHECIYVVQTSFPSPVADVLTRTGIVLALPALPWNQAAIRPHERTHEGPKNDRLRLMSATGAQTSPIFALWAGAERLTSLLERATRDPVLQHALFTGDLGPEQHRLWRVDDPELVNAICEAVEATSLYVADGHHRYETAVQYAREVGADPASDPAGRVMAYCCAADDPSVLVLATHRIVDHPALTSCDQLCAALPHGWQAFHVDGPVDAVRTFESVPSGDHAVIAVAADGAVLLRKGKSGAVSPRAGLDVSILDTELLPLVSSSASSLTYMRDGGAALAAVTGARAIAFLLRPCSVGDVLAVADAHETMPQKSTYFAPKVPTGLVVAPLNESYLAQ